MKGAPHRQTAAAAQATHRQTVGHSLSHASKLTLSIPPNTLPKKHCLKDECCCRCYSSPAANIPTGSACTACMSSLLALIAMYCLLGLRMAMIWRIAAAPSGPYCFSNAADCAAASCFCCRRDAANTSSRCGGDWYLQQQWLQHDGDGYSTRKSTSTTLGQPLQYVGGSCCMQLAWHVYPARANQSGRPATMRNTQPMVTHLSKCCLCLAVASRALTSNCCSCLPCCHLLGNSVLRFQPVVASPRVKAAYCCVS